MRLGILAMTLGLSASALANTPAATSTSAEQMKVELDAQMPGWLDETEVPSAAVAFIEDGTIAWTAAYGEQSPGRPADKRTLYNIASLTKPLVAETLLRLAARGMLDLDAPIADVFVDRDLGDEPRARAITLRHALSHRTGLAANWRSDLPDGKLRIDGEPATQAFYSGENYALAARYAMKVTNSRLDHLAREMVFDPSGMQDTWFIPDEAWEGRVAMVRGPDGTLRAPGNSPQGSAADDVHTTIEDYARFVAGAMIGQGLDENLERARSTIYDDQVEQACPPGILPEEMCPRHTGFGLGWMVYDSGDNRFMVHNGKDWGERTIALFEPSKMYGVVVFTSGANGREVISRTLKILVPDKKLNALVAAEARYERKQRDD